MYCACFPVVFFAVFLSPTVELSCWVCHRPRGETEGALLFPRQENPPRTRVYRRGAAEWGQCKPGLTRAIFWLTNRSGKLSCLSLASLFLLLLSGGAFQIFQSFKELFFAPWLLRIIREESLLADVSRSEEQVKQEMLGGLRNAPGFHSSDANELKRTFPNCYSLEKIKSFPKFSIWNC